MKLKLAILACLMNAPHIFALDGHGHDNKGHTESSNSKDAHEEHGDFNVEAYQITLKGTQAFGEACYLGVVAQGVTDAGLYFADIETSFQHEDEGPGRLRVLFDTKNPGLLTAAADNGSQISIQLTQNGKNAAQALRYAVKWVHEEHADTGLCSDLILVHDAAAESAEKPAQSTGTPPSAPKR